MGTLLAAAVQSRERSLLLQASLGAVHQLSLKGERAMWTVYWSIVAYGTLVVAVPYVVIRAFLHWIWTGKLEATQ
jgi:hypothetical protein